MSAWESYENRMDVIGPTRRTAALKRECRRLTNRLPDSLSYHTVVINDMEQEVAIIDSDNLNEKFIYSMPGGDIAHGGIVEWMDNHWLISERDAANEVYTRAKIMQCNYLLKWVDSEAVIHEQWCIVEDGTKLERVKSVRTERARNSLAYWKRYVKTFPLIAGTPLERYHQNRTAKSCIWNGLRTISIGQSAAKVRTGQGSTTIPVAGVHPSGWKRGTLNRLCGMVKI